MSIRTSCITGVMVFMAFTGMVKAQQAHIKVVDEKTRETIPYAHICLEGIKNYHQQHSLTGLDGRIANDIKEKSRLAISYVGYQTYIDTILPGQNLTVELKPIVLSMKEVVVTAQYTPEKADRSIYPISVINSRQLEQKGATNLTDALKSELGFRVTDGGVLGTNINLQGLSGENVKFLLDGVPLIGRMNGNLDLNQINLNNVDHIEVIEGPMSVIYGSNAMAGVINIISKENKIARLSASADAYFESAGTYNFNGGVTTKKGRNIAEINLGRNFFDGFSKPDTSRVQIYKPRRQYLGDAYYIYTMPGMKIKVSGSYFNELLLDKGMMDPYSLKAFDSYFTTIKYSGKLDGSKTFGKKRFLNFTASWSGYDRVKKKYYKDMTTLEKVLSPNASDHDTTTIQSWMIRSSYAKSDTSSPFNYQSGIDFNNESGTGKRILDNKQQVGDYAGFLSVKYDLTRNLSVQPGLRAIYNTKYDAPLVYSLSLKWEPFKNLHIRPGYSKGFRSPSIKELYLEFVDINHNVKGNPELRAEHSQNFSLSISYSLERNTRNIQAELSAFSNEVKDGIDLAWSGGDDLEYYYINVNRYRTQGIQISASASFYPYLSIRTGFSEIGRANTLNSNENESSAFFYYPEATADVSWKFQKASLTLSLFYKYTGTTPIYGFSVDQITESRIDPYHTMDLTVTKGFFFNRLRWSAGIKNIFDNTAIPASGASGGHGSGSGGSIDVGWGRTFFTRLSYTINQYN